jgi:hypothetical protein
MTSQKDDNAAAENDVLQVDQYGIKVRLQVHPVKLGERPRSWKEVGQRINQHLMAIAEGVFGVLAETMDGLKRVIRGTTSIPQSVADKIEGAHKQTSDREVDHQEVLEVFYCDEELYQKAEALLRLERKLQELRGRGLVAGITTDKEGRPVIYALKRAHKEQLAEVIRKALPSASTTRDTEGKGKD